MPSTHGADLGKTREATNALRGEEVFQMKFTFEFQEFEDAVRFARVFSRVTRVALNAAPHEVSIVEVCTSIGERKMREFAERYKGVLLAIEPEE